MPRVFGSPEAANMLLCFRKQLLLSEVMSTLQPDCLLNSHKSTAPVFDTEGCPTNTAISFVKHVGTPAFFKFYLPPPPPMQSLLSILKSVLEKKKHLQEIHIPVHWSGTTRVMRAVQDRLDSTDDVSRGKLYLISIMPL